LVVNDNGATDLLPALEGGAARLVQEDLNSNLRPFDDADMKALIVVTDGRDTSLERVTETANAIVAQGVRLYMIGWGAKIEADPIIQLTTKSGGHYYSTPGIETGEEDPFGVPIRIPDVSELVDWCNLDPADECDESLPNDLDSQVLLSYTTLNAQPSVIVTADLTFNDPNDQNSACLPEQGDISSGAEYRQQDFFAVLGDVRLGQVSLRTEGIANGEASIILRSDYTPRNITELVFDIAVLSLEAPTVTVNPIPQTSGGLISDWTQNVVGTEYTFSSPGGEPIRFSDFGDLLEIHISGVTQAFDVTLEISEPTYDGSNFETKYMTHPTGITVGGGEFLAASFPAPFFGSRPESLDLDGQYIIDVPSDTDQVEIDVFNLGGSHVAPGEVADLVTGEFDPLGIVNVGLFWEATTGAASSFLTFESDTPQSGFVTAYDDPSTMFINLNRSLTPPGDRVGEIFVVYGSGSVNSTGTLDPLEIRYTIEFPEFDINVFNTTTMLFEDLPGLFINFEATPDTADIEIANAGQSALQWNVDEDTLPPWLVLSSVAGSAVSEFPSVVTISIVRANLPLGNQFADIVFTADFIDPVTLTVSAEGVPP
ncbi:MAG: VWA domain-containing protein, partial [Candidatus Hydrogenedentes bacterium]|nr:VWA domain-containing protein [Candidatus Hydrogenedentota bacterium]